MRRYAISNCHSPPWVAAANRPNNAGTIEDHPTYVAIKGTVFDVSANKAYAPKASYHGRFII